MSRLQIRFHRSFSMAFFVLDHKAFTGLGSDLFVSSEYYLHFLSVCTQVLLSGYPNLNRQPRAASIFATCPPNMGLTIYRYLADRVRRNSVCVRQTNSRDRLWTDAVIVEPEDQRAIGICGSCNRYNRLRSIALFEDACPVSDNCRYYAGDDRMGQESGDDVHKFNGPLELECTRGDSSCESRQKNCVCKYQIFRLLLTKDADPQVAPEELIRGEKN